MNHNGKVLVVLPTLGDRLGPLQETLNSVEAQRGDVNLTLVVIAPASAKDARALAAEHGAVLVEDPMRGISHAINLGIQSATDEAYYAWIGDDDLFLAGALRTLQHMMESSEDTVLSYGACEYVGPDGRHLFTNRAGALAKLLLAWGPNLIPHPGAMIRLAEMRKVGLFDESLRYAMDLDLFLKLRASGRFRSTRTPVSAFRWHPGSLTVSNRAASSAEAAAVKHRHLRPALRRISPLWETPVRLLAARAAIRVSRRCEVNGIGKPLSRSHTQGGLPTSHRSAH